MFNNNTTAATCPQNVPVKNFENRSVFDEDMDNHKVGRFFETQCRCVGIFVCLSDWLVIRFRLVFLETSRRLFTDTAQHPIKLLV